MAPVSLPGKAPTPDKIDAPRGKLARLLHDLKGELLQRQLDLIRVRNATELATVVSKTADTLSAASAEWAAMSNTIRDSWRI